MSIDYFWVVASVWSMLPGSTSHLAWNGLSAYAAASVHPGLPRQSTNPEQGSAARAASPVLSSPATLTSRDPTLRLTPTATTHPDRVDPPSASHSPDHAATATAAPSPR